ncbi:MAG: hypothetical protein WCB68_03620, partial [Pyrinomonadaceae bacterium]
AFHSALSTQYSALLYMRARAIEKYHDLLARDGHLTPELFAHLKEGMRAGRLLYGERPIGVSLRPHFLTREQYNKLASASKILAGAFEKVAAALLSEPSLIDEVGLLEMERRLALVHPGFSQSGVTTRLDAFISGEEIKFVEYNAENPSSLPDQTGLNQILFEVRALQTFAERYHLRQFDPAASLLHALLATYREWGGRAEPHIAIVDWDNLPTEHEFILLRNYFASRGCPTIICSPEELEYDGTRLHRADFRIDVVYKRIIIHELLSKCDEKHPLIKAYVDRNVCLINPFPCKLMHKKAAFELLTDEERASWFTAEELEVIRRCVPWTRRVRERQTLYRGERIDLIEHVRKNRALFILKPNDDYGGHGVFLGHQASESEWEDHLSTALEADFIVQEIVELRTEEFPIFNDREWSIQPMFVDTNPFIFRGEVEGALVRLSDSPIVNVTSGGGETGFFVIEGEVEKQG